MVTQAQPTLTGNGTGYWWPSKYGPEDEAGALNEITPGRILEAVRLVRRGRVYDLAHVLHQISAWAKSPAPTCTSTCWSSRTPNCAGRPARGSRR